MIPKCEWCGQPAAKDNPRLCAECYYKYWYKQANKPADQLSGQLV